MEIQVKRYDQYLIHTKYVKIEVEGNIIGEWRKGLAIFKEKDYSYRSESRYYLIDESHICVYEANFEGSQIYRIIGGYYIVECQERYNFRTFPGKDRDTEYETRIVIRDVLDEAGRRLNDNDKKDFLKSNKIEKSFELGENIVFCNNSFYRLEDYSFLFRINKDINPIGVFHEGKLMVNVISDFRDFIVLVHQKKILHTIPLSVFQMVANVLDKNWDIEKALSEAEEQIIKYEEEKLPSNTEYEDFVPKLQTYIDGYYYGFPREYQFIEICNFEKNELGEWSHIVIPSTAFFHVGNKWIRILDTYSKPIFEEAFRLNHNRPNFIRKIDLLKSKIKIGNIEYDAYRFQCRPYGHILIDGTFDYDFDIENIKW